MEAVLPRERALLPSFHDIAARAARIPTYRTLAERPGVIEKKNGMFVDPTNYKRYRFITLAEFESCIDQFFTVMHEQLKRPEHWLNQSKELPLADILNPKKDIFVPFAQKIVLPLGSEFMCKGDLHEAAHAIIAFLKDMVKRGYCDPQNPFKIIKPNTYLFF